MSTVDLPPDVITRIISKNYYKPSFRNLLDNAPPEFKKYIQDNKKQIIRQSSIGFMKPRNGLEDIYCGSETIWLKSILKEGLHWIPWNCHSSVYDCLNNKGGCLGAKDVTHMNGKEKLINTLNFDTEVLHLTGNTEYKISQSLRYVDSITIACTTVPSTDVITLNFGIEFMHHIEWNNNSCAFEHILPIPLQFNDCIIKACPSLDIKVYLKRCEKVEHNEWCKLLTRRKFIDVEIENGIAEVSCESLHKTALMAIYVHSNESVLDSIKSIEFYTNFGVIYKCNKTQLRALQGHLNNVLTEIQERVPPKTSKSIVYPLLPGYESNYPSLNRIYKGVVKVTFDNTFDLSGRFIVVELRTAVMLRICQFGIGTIIG